jgi:hypothetical protein
MSEGDKGANEQAEALHELVRRMQPDGYTEFLPPRFIYRWLTPLVKAADVRLVDIMTTAGATRESRSGILLLITDDLHVEAEDKDAGDDGGDDAGSRRGPVVKRTSQVTSR